MLSSPCGTLGPKSGSGTVGEPLWTTRIGSRGTLLCDFLTCMMGTATAHGTSSETVFFCTDFYWIFVKIGLICFWFGFYLDLIWNFYADFVLWKLHEIKFIRSVVLFCVPEIFC